MSRLTWKDFQKLSEQKEATAGQGPGRPWIRRHHVEETRFGAIIPRDPRGGYQIQANTMRGLRNFFVIEEGGPDLQSDFGNDLTVVFPVEFIGDPPKLVVVLTSEPSKSRYLTGFSWSDFEVSNLTYKKAVRETTPDTEETAESVLEQLRDLGLSSQQRRKAVLAGEVLSFSPDNIEELCTLLRSFVLRHRDSNVPDDLVAVGAAIRKLVAYLPYEKLATLGDLLESSHRIAVPIEVELEVAKTVVRKLTANPPQTDDPIPGLADRLGEVAKTYVNPRLLAREKHGATALNAALALMLLRSPRADEVIDLVRSAETTWFTQLLCRRAGRLQGDLRRRVPAEDFSTVSRSLRECLERLCKEGS